MSVKRNLLLETALVTLLVAAVDWLWAPARVVVVLLSIAAGIALAARHGAARRAGENRLAVTLLLGGGLGLLISLLSAVPALALSSERGRLLQILGSLFAEPYEESWQVGLGRLMALAGFLLLLMLVWGLFAWRAGRRRRGGGPA